MLQESLTFVTSVFPEMIVGQNMSLVGETVNGTRTVEHMYGYRPHFLCQTNQWLEHNIILVIIGTFNIIGVPTYLYVAIDNSTFTTE